MAFCTAVAIASRFQSTPSVGRATAVYLPIVHRQTFQSTPSVGRATFILRQRVVGIEFQSTPSVGRATILFATFPLTLPFQSTPSVGRATHDSKALRLTWVFQSTPSVGRATVAISLTFASSKISIHALRGEGDSCRKSSQRKKPIFQSTPSVGRATIRSLSAGSRTYRFQSTPSVGRATNCYSAITAIFTISIHALRGEGDGGELTKEKVAKIFQSTPSVGRATPEGTATKAPLFYFNPRPPWGGRLNLPARVPLV